MRLMFDKDGCLKYASGGLFDLLAERNPRRCLETVPTRVVRQMEKEGYLDPAEPIHGEIVFVLSRHGRGVVDPDGILELSPRQHPAR